MVMPPSEAADENTAWLVSIVHDVVVFGDRPIRPEHAVLAVMHRVFLAQPVEIRPERIGAEQFGIAGDRTASSGIDQARSRAAFWRESAVEIDRSVHRASPGCASVRDWLRQGDFGANYIPLRARGKG